MTCGAQRRMSAGKVVEALESGFLDRYAWGYDQVRVHVNGQRAKLSECNMGTCSNGLELVCCFSQSLMLVGMCGMVAFATHPSRLERELSSLQVGAQRKNVVKQIRGANCRYSPSCIQKLHFAEGSFFVQMRNEPAISRARLTF